MERREVANFSMYCTYVCMYIHTYILVRITHIHTDYCGGEKVEVRGTIGTKWRLENHTGCHALWGPIICNP